MRNNPKQWAESSALWNTQQNTFLSRFYTFKDDLLLRINKEGFNPVVDFSFDPHKSQVCREIWSVVPYQRLSQKSKRITSTWLPSEGRLAMSLIVSISWGLTFSETMLSYSLTIFGCHRVYSICQYGTWCCCELCVLAPYIRQMWAIQDDNLMAGVFPIFWRWEPHFHPFILVVLLLHQ